MLHLGINDVMDMLLLFNLHGHRHYTVDGVFSDPGDPETRETGYHIVTRF